MIAPSVDHQLLGERVEVLFHLLQEGPIFLARRDGADEPECAAALVLETDPKSVAGEFELIGDAGDLEGFGPRIRDEVGDAQEGQK